MSKDQPSLTTAVQKRAPAKRLGHPELVQGSDWPPRQAAALLHTTLPGFLLLGSLLFAPLFWGCTSPLGIVLLSLFLLSATISWSLGMILRNRAAGLPRVFLLSILGLLLQGWLLALNGKSMCDHQTGFLLPVRGFLDWLPGSIDQDHSRQEMLRLSALFGAAVISAWFGRRRTWRRRILWTLVFAGAVTTLLGCVQRWTRAPDIFWNQSRQIDFFFATYRNVTNAGEYLNLVLPIAAALTLSAAVSQRRPGQTALGLAATVLLATGSCVCGSKIAPLITGANGILFVFLHRSLLRDQWAARHRGQLLFTSLIFLISLGAILASVGLGISWDRWGRVFQSDGTATFAHRLLVDRICLTATPDASLTGFGPGTFAAIFPYYQGHAADLTGFWTYAHNDYAQTMMEWGVLGAALWSVYFFGGFLQLKRAMSLLRPTEDRILALGLFQSLAGVAVTALVDFPLQIASIQISVAALTGLAWTSRQWLGRRVSKRMILPASGIFLARHPACPTLQIRTVS